MTPNQDEFDELVKQIQPTLKKMRRAALVAIAIQLVLFLAVIAGIFLLVKAIFF